MKRRTFVKSSLSTVAIGAANPIELGDIIAPDWENISPEEMDHFLLGLDGAMNRISEESGSGKFIANLIKKPMEENDINLFREGMRSLLIVGNFGDLSIEGQMHPGVQKRLFYSAPEIHSNIENIMDKMKTLSPKDRGAIKSSLRDDPTLGDRVLEAIDREASFSGAPKRRRRQLQRMGNSILRRLKHSPDLAIEEYLKKYEKLNSMPETEEEIRRFMAAHMGEKVANTRIQEAEDASLRWRMKEFSELPIGYHSMFSEEVLTSYEQLEVDERYKKGLRILGIGAITTSVGLVFLLLSGGGGLLYGLGLVAGVTVGPVLILIALIILLIKAIEGPSE